MTPILHISLDDSPFDIISYAKVLTFDFYLSNNHFANIAEMTDMGTSTRNSKVSVHDNSRRFPFGNVVGNKMTHFIHFVLFYKKKFGFSILIYKLVAQAFKIGLHIFFIQSVKTSDILNVRAFWKVITLSGNPIEFQCGNRHINDMTGGM